MVVVTPQLTVGISILLFFAVTIRIIYVFVTIWFAKPSLINKKEQNKPQIKVLAVLGSGGHTTEMLKLVKSLNPKVYKPLVFVIASTDELSLTKLNSFDSELIEKKEPVNENVDKYYELKGRKVSQFSLPSNDNDGARKSIVEKILRSREVGQSYFTSIFTTLIATLHALSIVFKHKPDLILVNGPGSCVPICICSVFFKLIWVVKTRITFVESFCRVQSLSLSGKILQWFVDDFIVQWPELKAKYPNSKYFGRIV